MIGDETALLLSALALGFVGSGHCLGMCGGIAGALGQLSGGRSDARTQSWLPTLLLSLGRLSSYAVLGAIAGLAGDSLDQLAGVGPIMRVVAGLLIIAFGFHAVGLGVGAEFLERAGLRVWRRIAPLAERIGAPDRGWKVLLLGALWGWLPCGLVYSALAVATVTGRPLRGAIFMFCFGLGTLPALVLASGIAGGLGRILRTRSARWSAASLLVLFGCWTIYTAIGPMLGSGSHSQHSHEQAALGSTNPGEAPRPPM